MNAALATVVHVDGSSYRRPGARMLITEDGQLTGAISGGCLERDALRKAQLAMAQQKSKLVTYDTSDEDDAKLGMGLGCNGIIQVLIEPVNESDPHNPLQLLSAVAGKRQHNVLITLFSLQNKWDNQYGTCLLASEDGGILGDPAILKETLLIDARSALVNGHTSFKNYILQSGSQTAFIELIRPPIHLVLAGAGNDAMPLVRIADILGWDTTVIDGRPDYATTQRFAHACNILVAKPGEAIEKILVDDQTVFLLMTHNYNYDMALLRTLLQKDVAYIGCLGPKKKLHSMIAELKDNGICLSEKQLSRLYAPVGLDIGAETSEEIALSVLAEIKMALSSRTGQSLRANEGTIHSREELLIEQINIQEAKNLSD